MIHQLAFSKKRDRPRSRAFDPSEAKGHSELDCGLAARPETQAWKPEAAPSLVEGAGGKVGGWGQVESIFLRDSVDQLTAGVRGHIDA